MKTQTTEIKMKREKHWNGYQTIYQWWTSRQVQKLNQSTIFSLYIVKDSSGKGFWLSLSTKERIGGTINPKFPFFQDCFKTLSEAKKYAEEKLNQWNTVS
jgi:hypothetical protein